LRNLTTAIAWRYSGLALQLLIIVLIARTVTIEVAGEYFSLFGLVTVIYIMSGLGIPDALVKSIPRLSASRADARSVAARGAILSTAINLGLTTAIALGLMFSGQSIEISLLLAVWTFAYCQVFLVSQTLIALSARGVGLFGAYSAINFGYLLTLVPYLILNSQHTLPGMITWACVGSLLALATMVLLAMRLNSRQLRRDFDTAGRLSASRRQARELIGEGLPMAISRLLQGSLPWVPVWFLVWQGDASSAAVYAAASRLAVAVTAILGSIRFGSRPDIVDRVRCEDWTAVERMSRQASYASGLGALLATIVIALAGSWLVPLVLGTEYASATTVLLILMVAIIAEGFGGLSDEILKMTGRTWVVLATLAVSVLTQSAMLVGVAQFGVVAASWTTVMAFAVQYILQVVWLRAYSPISIWPGLFGRSNRPWRV